MSFRGLPHLPRHTPQRALSSARAILAVGETSAASPGGRKFRSILRMPRAHFRSPLGRTASSARSISRNASPNERSSRTGKPPQAAPFACRLNKRRNWRVGQEKFSVNGNYVALPTDGRVSA